MSLLQIRDSWNNKFTDKKAQLASWDSMADRYFKEISLPDWKSDPFLGKLQNDIDWDESMSVLDIGCGTGIYSVVLADKVGRVFGVDISSKMLGYANSLTEKEDISNVTFVNADFNDFDIGNAKFDLVFAHMTPAISDASSFEKMLSLSSKYCYLIKPVFRIDPVFDKLKSMADSDSKSNELDSSMMYAFSILWQMGKLPTVSYHPAVWQMKKNIEEAKGWYLNRLKSHQEIDTETEKMLVDYLVGISADGIIEETIQTTICTMGWRMDERKLI